MRPSVRFASVAALVALSLPLFNASAQQQVPAAPAQEAAPSAPAPAAAPVFPKPDPANFTATTPTKETVNAFLQASWGYDENRVWQVQAILKTQVEGVSKVVIFVDEKGGKQQASAVEFFALPDGKHAIAGDQIITFGDKPYADYRAQLQQRADGPYRGAASKDLELVEFADFQCPHCKDAQANMDKLAVDFPKARIVFQPAPIASIHPQAVIAASYGVCVSKQGGSTAFFQFASAVFEGQSGLETPDGATLTLNSAVTKAGLDPAKIAACAATPQTKAEVLASNKLAADLGITAVPTLAINGRQVAANAPYETLKKVIEFQIKLDGLAQ
jgi:protein-disulfide isomerase